jgi:hypothetical protein
MNPGTALKAMTDALTAWIANTPDAAKSGGGPLA